MSLSLADHWRLFRNRLLMSAKFQRWSKAFPPTRRIARQRSLKLFDVLAGFSYSQVLFVFVKLGLVELLALSPRSVGEISSATGWVPEHCLRLMKACGALELTEAMGDGRYTLGSQGAALAGNPWISRFIAHHDLLYRDLADPLALLSGKMASTSLGSYWSYAKAAAGDGGYAAYSELMAASQRAVAEEVLAAHDFGSNAQLLDVGGGDGSFLRAVHERYPVLRLSLFDLPEVIAIARQNSPELALYPGNFHRDELPMGADVMTLIRIAHDHDDGAIERLLASIHAALPDGGTLVLAEPLSGEAGTARVTDAYFNIYFAAMGQGRTRTAAEFAAMGQRAGFRTSHQTATRLPLVTGIIVFKK